ncbi:MAG: NAD(P)/FAD-dependent oxidoreductase [Thermoplasmata archaeon]
MAVFDTIVIGGGHNGLVTAGYLAKAGASVLVLEKQAIVGGACITEETWPGFRINTFAYASGLLRPQITRDLELARYGYEPILSDPQQFVPFPDGRSLTFWLDDERTAKEIGLFSHRDARAYAKYVAYWDEVLDILEPMLMAAPPALGTFIDRFGGDRVETLLRDLFLRSARDFLDDWFESEEVKGALASSAIIGAFVGPGTPGTAYILGHHSIGALEGHRKVWGHTRGGMGRLTEAMARSATHHGAVIRTGVGVRRIVVQGGRATGVETMEGELHEARAVASSVDPKRTFLELLPPEAVDPDFAQRVRRIKAQGACLKFNTALSGLPTFRAGGPERLAGAVDISPSMDYLDRAFDEAKFGQFSRRPYIDAYFQTVADPSVAPPGQHTMTCFVQYAPTALRTGAWEDAKPDVAETVLGTLEDYAPDVRAKVLHAEVITPQDIYQRLGMPGGNIDQGDITPDQIFSFRPLVGWAQYRTPIPGLFLCGSSTHPGGGVIGAPGHNAAHVILDELKQAT